MRLANERNEMKTMRTYTAATAAVALLGLASASTAFANGSCNADQREKTFTGNISSIDTPDKTLAVKGFFFTRNFNAGNDCKVSLQEKSMASLSDLRPGEEVSIRYQDDNGVLIATHIAQHDLAVMGHITAVDPAARTIMVKHGLMTREFTIAQNCAVAMKDNKPAGLNNLQVGDEVRVVYESVNGSHLVSRIEQNSATFVGTIAAIDTTTRCVMAKDAKVEKKFNVADNCPIVINGKLDDRLNNLHIGERVVFSYNNVDGVLVANRISPDTQGWSTHDQAANPNPQWHDYTYTAP
jgi:Cu/Ag efflux protein CusF